MDLYLLFNFISAFWMAFGVYLLLQAGGELLGLSLLLLSSHIAAAGLAALLCRHFLPPFSLHWRSLKQRAIIPTLKTGFVLGSLTALAVVYQRSGTLTLSLVVGDTATGWYSAAVRIIESIKMVPYALFGAIFPIMARRAARNKRSNLLISRSPNVAVPDPQSPVSTIKSRSLYNLSFFILLAFAAGASLLLTLIARPLINLLYGPAYDPSVTALRILAWSLPPAVVTLRLSFDLVAAGRERIAVVATALTLSITLFLTWRLTTQYGLVGTCAAVVICETFQAFIFMLFTRRTYHPLRSSSVLSEPKNY
jgi:O-antigen/teichoic acid export membrane protein